MNTPPGHPRRWLVVGLLWFVVFSNFVARLLPTTMHGSIVAAIPMSETQFGLLTAALLWAYAFASPFGGFLADRFGRSGVIIASMAVWSTVTWLTSYAKTLDQLLILRSLMGLSEACYLPAALALISDYHPGPTRSFATGLHESGYVAGIGLSGVGGWIAERWNWAVAFQVIGVGSLVYCACLPFLLRDVPRQQPARAETSLRVGPALSSLLGTGSFLLLLATGALRGFVAWAVFAWTPVFLQETFRLSQAAASMSATGSMNAAAIVGLLAGGTWADRWSRSTRRGRMFVAAIGLFVAAPGIALLGGVHSLAWAIAGIVIYRLFASFSDANVMPVICEVVDPRYRATGYGVLNFVTATAAGAGIYLSGALRDAKIGLGVLFEVLAVLSAVSAALFALIRPTRPSP